MTELDDLAVAMRPANINRLNGALLDAQAQNAYRAEYVRTAIGAMRLNIE